MTHTNLRTHTRKMYTHAHTQNVYARTLSSPEEVACGLFGLNLEIIAQRSTMF